MLENIYALLDKWGQVPAVISVIVAILYMVWKGARWTARVDSDIGTLTQDVGALKQDVDAFKRDVDALKGIFKDFLQTLDKLLPLVSPSIERGSPLRLSEYGESVVASIGAEDWVEPVALKLQDEVKGMRPYQVERFCQSNIEDYLGETMRTSIDEAIYEFGLSRHEMRTMLWIMLRDRLLKFCQ
ncbi:MAG: hypothetical protein OXD30_08125 [Bryobacterales bacterium]|nr:hypothetical protein [Bryobacterales bacterium]